MKKRFINSFAGIPIRGAQLATLAPNSDVSDEVVNFFMKLLNQAYDCPLPALDAIPLF